jgi:hypothetical protein
MGSRTIASSPTYNLGPFGAHGYVLRVAVMLWRVVLPLVLILASAYLSLR